MAIFLFPAKVYGLGFPIRSDSLGYHLGLLGDMKNRSPDKYYTLITDNYSKISPYINPAISPVQREIIRAVMMRRLHITLIIPAFRLAPAGIQNANGAVSFRLADNRDSRRLMARYPAPFVTTSANISSRPPVRTPRGIAQLRHNHKINIIKTSKYNITGEVSAVLDLSGDSPVVIRYGKDIEKLGI